MAGNARHILNPQHVLKAAHKALDQGLYDECLRIVDGLLSNGQQDPEAQLLAGIACYSTSKYQQALSYFLPLLELFPTYTEVHYFAGNCLLKTFNYERAIHHFTEASRLDPNQMADAVLGIAMSYAGLNDFPQAKASFIEALKQSPSMPSLWNEYGNFLRVNGQIEEAQKIHGLVALKSQGFLPTPHLNDVYNLAQYLVYAEDYAGAEPLFAEVLKELPDEPNSIWGLGQIACLTGDIETGFHLLESRWEIGGGHPSKRDPAFIPQDEYCGQPLAGKTVIILDEQGIGDFLLFASCLNDVIRQAKHVVIEAPAKLVTLLRRSFPTATIMPVRESKSDPYKRYYLYDWLDQVPAFDYYCGIGSLPRALRKRLKYFTGEAFLKPDPARAQSWTQRLKGLGEGLKIGLCYRGGVSEGKRTKSYTEIEHWKDVFSANHHLVNLVYDSTAEERLKFNEITGHKLHMFDGLDLYDDMENTAAMIAGLDVVISVASTNVELAAALGTKSIRMTARPDWTMLGTDQRPWFRQQLVISKGYFETWPDVMGQVRNALAGFVIPAKAGIQRQGHQNDHGAT